MSHIDKARAYEQTKIALLRRAIEHDPQSDGLLFDLADLLAERGEYDEYARVFQAAYRLRPKGLWPSDIRREAKKLRDKTRALVDRGVNYSSVLAALAVSSAILRDRTTVERLVDYDRLFSLVWDVWPKEFSQSDFFVALASEIKSGLRFYDTPEKAIRKAWRHNDILNSHSPACRALAGEILTQVDRYIGNLPPENSHPYFASRPVEFRIESWAVVSGGESFHEPHIHPRAWASGVYYVVCPEVSREANSDRGWLRIGPPVEYNISSGDGWQTRMAAPEPGTLVLMPAYFFHDTSPMGVDQERICIAFDVTPIELTSRNSS
jgi:hypothetical protein